MIPSGAGISAFLVRIALGLVITFPQIAMWLPGTMGK